MWPEGTKFPLAASDPCSGTTGAMSWLRSSRRTSATTGRTADGPIAWTLALRSIMLRAISLGTIGPTPTAWLTIVFRWTDRMASVDGCARCRLHSRR